MTAEASRMGVKEVPGQRGQAVERVRADVESGAVLVVSDVSS